MFQSEPSKTGSKIILIEDDVFTLATLESALTAHGVKVLAAITDASSAIKAAQKYQPDAAIIDLDLGMGPTGIDVAISLRRQIAHLGIVLLTSYQDPRLLRSRLPPLPVGTQYLVKSTIKDINKVVEAINQSTSNTEIDRGQSKIQSDITMTDAQIETMRLVAQGYSNAQIAQLRYVTEKTVEQTISRIAQQLELISVETKNQRVNMARAYFRLIGRENL